jgi:parvulin-like peptidyl-prolyl isomerase
LQSLALIGKQEKKMGRLLVCILLLGSSVYNAEAISSAGPVSNQEEYAQFWRAFPELFPGEKLYLGEQPIQKAQEDKLVEDVLANRAKMRGLTLDEKQRELLKRFEQAWLARKVYDQQVLASVEITSEQITRFYATHKKDYFEPESVDIGQIFVELPPGATDQQHHQARSKIEAALKALKSGEPFEEVAKRYSEAESAEFGGRAGRLPRGQADKNIEKAAFTLKNGGLSGIIQSENGFHILKSFGTYPARQRPLDEVAAAIESRLRQEQEKALREQLLKTLANADDVSTFFNRLDGATYSTILLQLGKEKFTYQDFTDHAKKARFAAEPSQWPRLWPHLFQEELMAMAARKLGLDSNADFLQKRRWVENYLLSQAYLEKVVYSKIQVSPEEIRNYYKQHKTSFIRLEHARCQVLSVRPLLLPENPAQSHRMLRQLQQRLETFLHSLPSAGSFAREAQKLAKDLRGAKFYDTGMIVPASLGRHFDWAVEKLEPGELSPVVEQDGGFFIIRCLAKEPARGSTFTEAKERIEQVLRRQKQIQRLQELRDQIMKKKSPLPSNEQGRNGKP